MSEEQDEQQLAMNRACGSSADGRHPQERGIFDSPINQEREERTARLAPKTHLEKHLERAAQDSEQVIDAGDRERRLLKQVAALKQENRELATQIAGNRNDIQKSLEELSKTKVDAQRTCDELTKEINRRQSTIDHLRQCNENIQSSLGVARERVGGLQAELYSLKGELVLAKSKQYKPDDTELNELRKKLSDEQLETRKFTQELHNLLNDLYDRICKLPGNKSFGPYNTQLERISSLFETLFSIEKYVRENVKCSINAHSETFDMQLKEKNAEIERLNADLLDLELKNYQARVVESLQRENKHLKEFLAQPLTINQPIIATFAAPLKPLEPGEQLYRKYELQAAYDHAYKIGALTGERNVMAAMLGLELVEKRNEIKDSKEPGCYAQA